MTEHRVGIRQAMLCRGGSAYCSCGWVGRWRETCVKAAADAERHEERHAPESNQFQPSEDSP